jgi:hypothetical protein
VRAALARGLIYQLAASNAKVFARVAEGERIVIGRERHHDTNGRREPTAAPLLLGGTCWFPVGSPGL